MIWTAFILGLAGSLHCVGMCGPIALLVSGSGSSFSNQISKTLAYNIGRISVYALLGSLFGWLGKGFFIAGWQQNISILFGGLIILGVIFPSVVRKWKPDSILFSKINQLKSRLFPLIKKQTAFGSFVVGMLNALLPCGLIYIAIAGAVLMGSPLLAAQYMAVFGIGTAVVLMPFSISGSALIKRFKAQYSKTLPVIMVVVGLLFVLRGLNLGIPYVSPKIEQNQTVKCH